MLLWLCHWVDIVFRISYNELFWVCVLHNIFKMLTRILKLSQIFFIRRGIHLILWKKFCVLLFSFAWYALNVKIVTTIPGLPYAMTIKNRFTISNQLWMRSLEIIYGNKKKLWQKTRVFTPPSKCLHFRNSPCAKNVPLQLEIDKVGKWSIPVVYMDGILLPCMHGFLMDRYF